MDNLNIKTLCENSSSEQIHVWFPGKKNGEKVTSVDMDASNAYKEYIKGASLYFGSSVEFREVFVK